MDASEIEYRDLAEFPGYRVGSELSVWSSWTRGKYPRIDGPWHRLTPFPNGDGYLYVGIARRHYAVHALYLIAFVGPRPLGFVARHLDDDRTNNAPENLAWGTYSQNLSDAIRNGKTPVGSGKRNAKLDEMKVAEIKRLRLLGVSRKELANQFGVHVSRIQFIDQGKNWAHVEANQ